MRISVIILNWNRPRDTLQAAESVLRQDHADLELILWDNASSDDSREILTRRFHGEPRVVLRFADANYGVAGGRNRAFPLAGGEILVSLDSDAVFESAGALSHIASCFRDDPDLGAVSFEVKRPDGHLMWPFTRPAATWRHRPFETIRVDGCSFATTRTAFAKAGGFAEHFSPYGAEDQHYALTLIGLGYRVLYLPSVVVVHAFSPRGRVGVQFIKHVRNSLWIPLELFPFPHAFLSAGKQAWSLLGDAREQRQVPEYFRGLAETLMGFHPARRKPIRRERWRHVRALIAEDKAGGSAA
jgi:GT2 family glycosyltransferase